MTRTATFVDRFLTVPPLIERWHIGRTMVYQLINSPDFATALVLLRDCHGQPRSTGAMETDSVAYESCHKVQASGFDLSGGDGEQSPDLPPAKLAQSQRSAC